MLYKQYHSSLHIHNFYLLSTPSHTLAGLNFFPMSFLYPPLSEDIIRCLLFSLLNTFSLSVCMSFFFPGNKWCARIRFSTLFIFNIHLCRLCFFAFTMLLSTSAPSLRAKRAPKTNHVTKSHPARIPFQLSYIFHFDFAPLLTKNIKKNLYSLAFYLIK